MKCIVVFGATGDVGRYFIDYLLKCDRNYVIYAIGKRKHFCVFSGNDKVQYISMDITNKASFMLLPAKADVVVDFAGIMPARMRGYNPQQYVDVNITGTLNILEYCRLAKVDRILFMQSFGDIKDHGDRCTLLSANMPRKFSFKSDHTVYVLTKNFAVDLIENYHQMYGIKNFIFRLPTIYLYSKNDKYFVNGKERKIGYRILIEKAMNGEEIEVWGDSKRVKDMIYVKDFCQMLAKAIDIDLESGYYNVGTGIGVSLFDQIKGIIAVFGNNNTIVRRPDMPNAPQYIMDISEAKKDLGYKPKYDYQAMLNDFRDEMKTQRLYKGE